MNNPLVSIIIPTFNRADYLPETIASIAQQDYRPIEVIIVDDGSTDKTSEVVAQMDYAGMDIRYTKIPASGGPSKPRNVGIDLALGECLFFFDSDDIMLPGKIRATVNAYRVGKHLQIGLYFTNFCKTTVSAPPYPTPLLANYVDFQRSVKKTLPRGLSVLEPGVAYTTLCSENYIGTSGVMVPRRMFNNATYRFDETLRNSEDRDLWFRIAKSHALGYVDIIGHCYRTHAAAISTTESRQNMDNRIAVLERQLSQRPSALQRKRITRLIRVNKRSLAYWHESQGDYASARQLYWQLATQAGDISATCRIGATFVKQLAVRDVRKHISEPMRKSTELVVD